MTYTKYYNIPLGTMIGASDRKSLFGLWFEGQKYIAPIQEAQQKELPVFKQQSNGQKCILLRRIRPLPRLYYCKAAISAKMCGKFCLRFPLERQRLTKRLQSKSHAKGAFLRCRHKLLAMQGIILSPSLFLATQVIGSDKSLTGYAGGGLNRKMWLLELEKAMC